MQVFSKDLLAVADVVPETLHVVQLKLDLINVLVATVNQVRVFELFGGEAEIGGLLLVVSNLREDSVKLLKSRFTTAIILVEVTLLHFLDEELEFILELANLNVVLLGLGGDDWGDFLLDVLGQFLETSPVLEEFLCLFDLVVLGEVLGGKEVKGLLKLIELQEHVVRVVVN